ncbi:ATP-binding cassette domain-containing protein [Streptomyces sp. NPDC003374]
MDGLGVVAHDFGLRGPRGWAFRGIGIDAEPGSLIAVEGPSGSGRTCLLLALTGRMRPTEGVATVGGFTPPRHMSALRRASQLANVTGVTDLEPALTVGEHLRERALLQRRFGASLRWLLRPRAEQRAEGKLLIDAALAAAGLDTASLPKGARTAVRDLERLEELRLSIALALMARPRLLAVDDADFKLSDAERAEVWALLRSIAESGTTVLAACSEAPRDAVVVSTRDCADRASDPANGDRADGAKGRAGRANGDRADGSKGRARKARSRTGGAGNAVGEEATRTGGVQTTAGEEATRTGEAETTAGEEATRPGGAEGGTGRTQRPTAGAENPAGKAESRTAGAENSTGEAGDRTGEAGGRTGAPEDAARGKDEEKGAADALAETGRS